MKIHVNTKLEKHDSNMWGNIFRIPTEVAEQFVDGNDRRILCLINEVENIHCALMPSPEGYFILVNQAVVKKLKLQQNEAVNIVIQKDNSEFGMPVSEAFKHVILNDEQISHYFNDLTPGKKRNLIHLVNSVKNPDIQINRSMAIADHLQSEKGKLDFKKLNETIKQYNQKNKLN